MNIKDKKAPANAEADKKMVIRRYDCKTGMVSESLFVYGFKFKAHGSFTAYKR